MLWTIAVVLVILWLLGLVSGYTKGDPTRPVTRAVRSIISNVIPQLFDDGWEEEA